jgi:hypothetical protein
MTKKQEDGSQDKMFQDYYAYNTNGHKAHFQEIFTLAYKIY